VFFVKSAEGVEKKGDDLRVLAKRGKEGGRSERWGSEQFQIGNSLGIPPVFS
jgi:hypothetical protein